MKMAKSYKIIILLSAIMMCLISAFSLMGFTSAKAENTALASRYFDGGILDIKDGKVVSQLSEGETLKIKNKLVVDDLSIVMQIPTAVQKLNVKLTASSFDVNAKI